MDIIGSSIALYQLTSDVIRLCLKCRKGLKEASKEFNDLIQELRTFTTTLNAFREVAETCETEDEEENSGPGQAKFEALRQALTSGEVLLRCHADLEAIKQKLEKWQTAGGAKAVLAHISWPFKKDDILAQIRSLKRVEHTLNSAIAVDHVRLTESIQQDVVGIRQSDIKQQLLKWLDAPDPATNLAFHIQKRVEHTGNWLLESSDFEEWRQQLNSFLWINGMAGCGKSVLSATVIDELLRANGSRQGCVVLYYFFDFQELRKQDVASLCRSLLRQLCAALPATSRALHEIHQAYTSGRGVLTNKAMIGMLRKAKESLEQIYITIDALDECTEQETLLELLQEIHEWDLASLHLIVTSRDYKNIQEGLADLLTHTISIENSSISNDIELFIQNTLEQARPFNKLNDDLKTLIKETLMNQAQGMFRWSDEILCSSGAEKTIHVECQFETLRHCKTSKDHRNTLSSLPTDLNKTYERMLDTIPYANRGRALKVLSLLVCSERPLDLLEVAEATAITLEGPCYLDPEDRLLDPLDVLELCPGLVSRQEKIDLPDWEESRCSQAISNYGDLRLAHFSIKEFLSRSTVSPGPSRQLWYAMSSPRADDLVAQICAAYTLHSEPTWRKIIARQVDSYADAPPKCVPIRQAHAEILSEILLELPFTIFAAENWARFIRTCDSNPFLPSHSLAQRLVSTRVHDPFRIAARDCLEWRESCFDVFPDSPGISHELYLASDHGLYQVCASLLAAGAKPSEAWGHKGSALHAACSGSEGSNSRLQIVQLLLEHDADVNAQHDPLGTALHVASDFLEPAVEMLLRHGADIEALNDAGQTALFIAVEQGSAEAVQLLLKHGARVNVQDPSGHTPISMQPRYYGSRKEIVKGLLRHGADASLGRGVSIAREISIDSDRATVELLWAAGADIHSQDSFLGTPLHTAASCGDKTIFDFALAKGARTDVIAGRGQSVIAAAATGGNEEIVRCLLDRGVDVNTVSERYGTVLSAACYGEHMDVVQLLIDRGAEINAVGGWYGTALNVACDRANRDLVQLLLDHGADPNSGIRPSDAAVEAVCDGMGQGEVVDVPQLIKVALEVTCNGNAGDDEKWGIAQLLLRRGADPCLLRGKWSKEAWESLNARYKQA